MNHYKRLWHLSASRAKTIPLSACPYLTNGSHTDTYIITHISGTKVDKHTQCTHIARINGTGLDPLHLQWKTQHRWWGRGGERRGGGLLFSQMKWKACVAAICQSKQRFNSGSDYRGIFFTVLPLKLHCGGEEEGGWRERAWDKGRMTSESFTLMMLSVRFVQDNMSTFDKSWDNWAPIQNGAWHREDLLVSVALTQSSCEFSETERQDGGNEEKRNTW